MRPSEAKELFNMVLAHFGRETTSADITRVWLTGLSAITMDDAGAAIEMCIEQKPEYMPTWGEFKLAADEARRERVAAVSEEKQQRLLGSGQQQRREYNPRASSAYVERAAEHIRQIRAGKMTGDEAVQLLHDEFGISDDEPPPAGETSDGVCHKCSGPVKVGSPCWACCRCAWTSADGQCHMVGTVSSATRGGKRGKAATFYCLWHQQQSAMGWGHAAFGDWLKAQRENDVQRATPWSRYEFEDLWAATSGKAALPQQHERVEA
jgi:hypothetical protein